MTATRTTTAPDAWRGFRGSLWQREINVRAFIQLNHTPYEGDGVRFASSPAI
jgi:formate C-acetyltransferase